MKSTKVPSAVSYEYPVKNTDKLGEEVDLVASWTNSTSCPTNEATVS